MRNTYSETVKQTGAYLSLTLRLQEPVEITDFARVFAGFGDVFDDYLRAEHPGLNARAQLYVTEVRKGSMIADLVPSIPDLIDYADKILIVGGVGALFSARVRRLMTGKWLDGAKKSDIQHIADTVRAVALDPNGTALLEEVTLEEDGEKRRLVVKFDTMQARKIVETVEAQTKALESVSRADYERKLMVFTRSDVTDAQIGKRSGERVVVEEISEKPLALMYGSELAEQRVKHEIRGDESVYKRGFVVDVNVETRGGRPVAYSVTHVHDVIDLPDDD